MAIVFDSDAGTITGLSVGGLPDGTVDAGTLASNAVTAAKLATDSVTAAKIAANSVDSAELVDGSIDTAHIGNSQITQAKMNANAVTTAVIADGAVTGAKVAAGAVIQVVSSTAKRYTSTSSQTFVDTGVTATITPSATSSKILAIYDSGLCYQNDQVNYYAIYTMLRGSTNIGNSGGGFSGDYHYGGADWNDKGYNVSFQTLDSPSTTSATTYKIQFKVGSTGGTIYNDLEGYSTITLMEIAG